jgi:hypothetical protein
MPPFSGLAREGRPLKCADIRRAGATGGQSGYSPLTFNPLPRRGEAETKRNREKLRFQKSLLTSLYEGRDKKGRGGRRVQEETRILGAIGL